MSQRLTLEDLMAEHVAIEAGQVSPYITEMENYYVSHPAGFRGKIMLADWIPHSVRVHMVEHIAARLSRQRRRARRFTFRQFISDPVMVRVQTRRLIYSKRADTGQVLKRWRKNGRFTKFNRQERRQLQKVKASGK
jgi:hypothetical protein